MAPKARNGSILRAAGRSVSSATRTSTPNLAVAGRGGASNKEDTGASGRAARAVRTKSSSVNNSIGRSSVPRLSVGSVLPSLGKAAGNRHGDRKAVAAAVRVQAYFRGHLARCLVVRMRVRLEQKRLEDEHDRKEKAKREAAAAAKREAQEAAKRKLEEQRELQLRNFRDRRNTVEIMCQSLPCQERPWEEDSGVLLSLLDNSSACNAEAWLGRHHSRKAARKQYLACARRWHPDKWSQQGEQSVAAATEVTKCLVRAYEATMKLLPPDNCTVSCEDEDEDRECYEFASWVGVAFDGMFDVWKERKGVTSGK